MREAVVAIFTYKNEILSITRQDHLRAFPGYSSFPGGKIDKEDFEYSPNHNLLNAFKKPELGALFREIEEELNYSLESAIQQGFVKDFCKLGIAVTPQFERFRFSAHYYKIELTEKFTPQPDEGEIKWVGWLPCNELYKQYEDGKALMVIPTKNTIEALTNDINLQYIPHLNLEYDASTELPYIELIKSVGCIPIPSNTLPPAHTTNSLILGDKGCLKIITDPSPASADVFDLLINTLKKFKIDAVFVTHHHPDHHERAPELARKLNIPFYCSATTEMRLKLNYGADYLKNIDVRQIKQNDIITQWLGKNIICHELPGHDDGMVGLAAEDMSWFYVSDLAIANTSVVIPEPEGNMQDYFDSLKYVIALKPSVIIPSHGLPCGGVKIIEKALLHREKRESQILKLANEGLNPNEITKRIYSNINEKLRCLAEQNVRQHLRKLGLLT